VQSRGEFTSDSKSLDEIAGFRPTAPQIMEEVDFDG
jgi:hypothetical protein